jgi:hypothetical protein
MPDPDPVIIVGAARSGTKILRDLVCSLPGHATWPCDEINYIWRHGNRAAPTDEMTIADARPDVIRYIRAKLRAQQLRADGAAIVEKTCATTLRVAFAHRIFPEARFVVIVRDGRDAAASAAARWTAPIPLPYLARKARFVPLNDVPYYAMQQWRWRNARRRSPDGHIASWGPRFAGLDEAVRTRPLVEVCALQWRRCVDAADAQLDEHVHPDAVHRVSYEQLVQSPDQEIERLARFLGVGVTPSAQRPSVTASHVGLWRQALSEQAAQAIECVAGPTLSRYGYVA